tara:strand:+ start:2913 stop:4523 length:1611 start_codon:yes stop_codon:yes gene_type:complete
MTVGKGSYFKGWASTLPSTPKISAGGSAQEVWIGHVLDVYYNQEPGKIRVRLIGVSKEESEKDINIFAYPADANIVKYPLPGEIVFILQGIQNQVAKNKFVTAYYYIASVTSNQSITFNSDPYMGTTVPAKEAANIFTPEYEHRFEKKLTSPQSLILPGGSGVKEKSPLRPYEGDFILQGRFGSSIRFGSTSANRSDNQWSDKGGAPGNPLTIVTANRTKGSDLITEDVNKNDSTVYICTSQTIPVELCTSKHLRTHLRRYDLPTNDGDIITTNSDITSFVESPEEEVARFDLSGPDSDITTLTPIIGSTTIKQVISSVPDSLLDPIVPGSSGPFLDNDKQTLQLILIDSKGLETVAGKAFLAMKKAAQADGVLIKLGSGYRPQFGQNFIGKSSSGKTVVFETQESLRRDKARWKADERKKFKDDEDYIFKAKSSAYSPQTAPPGKSKHGNGIAADVNVGSRVSFGGTLNSTNYVWMIKNSYRFGYVRTVSNEEWHFEYQPEMALNGPYGGIPSALKNQGKRNASMFYSDLGLDTL